MNTDKDRFSKMICVKNNNMPHESGEWELAETHIIYKRYVKKCKCCGAITNENIQKR